MLRARHGTAAVGGVVWTVLESHAGAVAMFAPLVALRFSAPQFWQESTERSGREFSGLRARPVVQEMSHSRGRSRSGSRYSNGACRLAKSS